MAVCTISGYVKDAQDVPVSGACIEVYAVTPQDVATIQKHKRTISTHTNEEGYFEIDLSRNTLVNFVIKGTDIDFQKTVPDAASQDFDTWP